VVGGGGWIGDSGGDAVARDAVAAASLRRWHKGGGAVGEMESAAPSHRCGGPAGWQRPSPSCACRVDWHKRKGDGAERRRRRLHAVVWAVTSCPSTQPAVRRRVRVCACACVCAEEATCRGRRRRRRIWRYRRRWCGWQSHSDSHGDRGGGRWRRGREERRLLRGPMKIGSVKMDSAAWRWCQAAWTAWGGGGKRNRRQGEQGRRCNAGARYGEMAAVESGGVPSCDRMLGWR